MMVMHWLQEAIGSEADEDHREERLRRLDSTLRVTAMDQIITTRMPDWWDARYIPQTTTTPATSRTFGF